MSAPRKGDGKGRSARLFITVSPEDYQFSAMDREVGRFNDKMNRVYQIIYRNGGRTDSIQILKAELRAEIGRLEAQLASLDAQEEAATEAFAQEQRIKKAEEAFRDHIRQAKDHGVEFKHWLHAGRADVKAVGGLTIAKRILADEGVKL